MLRQVIEGKKFVRIINSMERQTDSMVGNWDPRIRHRQHVRDSEKRDQGAHD